MSELNFAGIRFISRNRRAIPNAGIISGTYAGRKKNLMREYCAKISTEKVAAYCRYCVRGLKLGGKSAFHLAQLLFESEKILRT